MENDDDLAMGWKAIERPLKELYPAQEPLHWGTIIRYRLGGNDPLDGISAYQSNHDRPHWHFVSFGMSELYAKECENKEYSGWGFEFTFRLTQGTNEAEPPMWVLSFLQNLARYVYESGNTFGPGHHMPLNGPIAHNTETDIQSIIFINDPELPPMETPNGKVACLQIVGITNDELTAAQDGTRWAWRDCCRIQIPFASPTWSGNQ